MKKFKILDNIIDFEEDIQVCSSIYSQQNKCILDYTQKYNQVKIPLLSTLENLILYMENLTKTINESISQATDNVLNIFIANKIFDKSNKDILLKCTALKQCNNYLENVMREIEFVANENNSLMEYFKDSTARAVDNAVEGNYIGVISSSMWDLVATDYINLKEEQRVERKKEKIYNNRIAEGKKEIQKLESDFVKEKQEKIKTELLPFGKIAIEQIYLYCIEVLITENKISSSIVNSLDKNKSLTILENIERLQDNTEMQKQIVIALKIYPFSSEVHRKILEYDITDVNEYIELVRYLKCENIVLEVCVSLCKDLKNENDKYVKIINLIDNEYIKNFTFENKTSKIEENNIAKKDENIDLIVSNLNYNRKESLSFNCKYEKVYDEFLYASFSIGEVIQQSKKSGNIVVKCPKSIFQMILQMAGYATITIEIIKVSEEETKVDITSFAKSKGLLVDSTIVWKNILLKKVKKRIF